MEDTITHNMQAHVNTVHVIKFCTLIYLQSTKRLINTGTINQINVIEHTPDTKVNTERDMVRISVHNMLLEA